MAKYRAVPQIKQDTELARAVAVLKENFEVLTCQRGEKIGELPATATLADVIEFVNTLARKLQ